MLTAQAQPPWHRSIPYFHPEICAAMIAESKVGALLDSCPADPRGRYAYVCLDPVRIFSNAEDWSSIADYLAGRRLGTVPDLPPFQGGIAGCISYEFGFRHEGRHLKSRHNSPFSDIVLGAYETIAAFDSVSKNAWIVSHAEHPEIAADRLLDKFHSASAGIHDSGSAWRIFAAPEESRFAEMVEQAKNHIFAGDIYQANISQRYAGTLPDDLPPALIYQRLRQLSPSPFSAFLKLGNDDWLASASPEQFLSVNETGHARTRPIKGTRKRHADSVLDRLEAEGLLASEKDRSENLMIVDLMRNDLGRFAEPGSVRVGSLCELETFASVHHLVSEIDAQLETGVTSCELLRGSFPGGSITGAPKLRAMEIIDALEPVARGPFCGSVVALGYDGSMMSSIVIRTIFGQGKTAYAQAGCGIVADSDAHDEYREAMTKLKPLLTALDPAWQSPS